MNWVSKEFAASLLVTSLKCPYPTLNLLAFDNNRANTEQRTLMDDDNW